MQGPRVANQYVTNLQWDRLHSNLTGFHGSKRFISRHTVCARRDFDRAILQRYTTKPKLTTKA
jgi:hypothetical protein